MIIFLYGEDIFRLRRKEGAIVKSYKLSQKSGFNLYFFDLGQSYGSFKKQLKLNSFYQEKRLFVLKNIFGSIDFKKNFLERKDFYRGNKDIFLFIQEGKIKEDKFLVQLKSSAQKSQSFGYLKGQKLREWIKREVVSLGGEISEEAIGKLVLYLGNDTWLLENNILKLISFQKKISDLSIDDLVAPKLEVRVFDFIDALGKRDKRKALLLLNKALEQGENPSYLLSMIAFQFRNILFVKDFLAKGKYVRSLPGIKPYPLRKAYYFSHSFSLGEIRKIYKRIIRLDLMLKSGNVRTAEDFLKDFVLSI